MRTRVISVITLILIITGCAELTRMIQTSSPPALLTEAEVISSLKEALINGAKNSAQRLSVRISSIL